MGIYDILRDKSIIRDVNQAFYDKVYDHEWLSMFFQAVTKEHIINQQTDFITPDIGGPKNYSGRLPYNAHPHMFITDEVFDLRSSSLTEALDEAGAPLELKEAWLRIDSSFRHVIIDQCSKRYAIDEILSFEAPGRNVPTSEHSELVRRRTGPEESKVHAGVNFWPV